MTDTYRDAFHAGSSGRTLLRVPDPDEIGDWTVVDINATGVALLGLPTPDLKGGLLVDVFPEFARSRLVEHYRRVRRTGEPEQYRVLYGDRQVSDAVWTVSVDRVGEDLLLVEFVDDTEHANIQAALADFAELVSHDLRSPLRTAGICSDLLREEGQGVLPERLDDYARRIQDAVRRAYAMLTEARRRLSASNAEPTTPPVDLKSVVVAVVSSLEGLTRARGATVEVGELPVVDTDEARLTPILASLIRQVVDDAGEGDHVRVDAQRVGPTWKLTCAIGDQSPRHMIDLPATPED